MAPLPRSNTRQHCSPPLGAIALRSLFFYSDTPLPVSPLPIGPDFFRAKLYLYTYPSNLLTVIDNTDAAESLKRQNIILGDIVKHNCVTQVHLMANWTTTCFGPYWPSSGRLKRTGLGSYYMHCARTRGVEISTPRVRAQCI